MAISKAERQHYIERKIIKMKKSKKFLSVLPAISMILAMSVSAFAVEVPTDEILPPPTLITYKDLHGDIDNAVMAAVLSNDTISCYIPYNTGNGTTGSIAASFTAESSTVNFILYSYGGGTNYHTELWHVNGDHMPNNKVMSYNDYNDYAFGSGFSQSGLQVGDTYYIMVSSQTVTPPGVQGAYELSWS